MLRGNLFHARLQALGIPSCNHFYERTIFSLPKIYLSESGTRGATGARSLVVKTGNVERETLSGIYFGLAGTVNHGGTVTRDTFGKRCGREVNFKCRGFRLKHRIEYDLALCPAGRTNPGAQNKILDRGRDIHFS